MIYMDHAATSYPKPIEVHRALTDALHFSGNPGRGSHKMAVWAGNTILEAREQLAQLFHIPEPQRIAFTGNATHALNIAIHLCYGEILTTAMEHNSVLRPCAHRGYYRIVPADHQGHIPPENVIAALSDVTGAVVMTHASNVTGEVYDVEPIARECRKRGILFILDAAQSAGTVPLDMSQIPLDILCLTGHKGLSGIQGTGAIYVAPHVELQPYLRGGTGTQTFDLHHPRQMPECMEAGTVNTHGIAALRAGVKYVCDYGVSQIHQQEMMLRQYFIDALRDLSDICVYGSPHAMDYTGVVSLNVIGVDPGTVGDYLSAHDICVRTGYHCAPLAHQTLGTKSLGGTVRFALNHLNTKQEIDQVVCVLHDFCKNQKN